jgi:pilus assembly protein Flp/PilA
LSDRHQLRAHTLCACDGSLNEGKKEKAMSKLYNLMPRLKQDERGLTAVEYAVLGAIIVAAIGVAGAQFQTELTAAFTSLFDSI